MATTKTKGADVTELAGRVNSAATFAEFVRALAANLQRGDPDWENDDLPRYLDALARWVDDSAGYYAAQGLPAPEQPTWKHVADMLIAATMYE